MAEECREKVLGGCFSATETITPTVNVQQGNVSGCTARSRHGYNRAHINALIVCDSIAALKVDVCA